RVWTTVVAGNGVMMTIFLWHLTAALLAIAVLYNVGFPQPTGGSALWWATRPLWIAAAAIPLAALVAIFGRLERPRPTRYRKVGVEAPAAIGIGTALLSVVVFGIACSNCADLLANKGIDLAVVPVTPMQLVLAGIAGAALVRYAARRAVV